MDKYYVLVSGSGTTTRANLEALMEDHYYSNGPDGVLVLPIKTKPSQGQVFAAQFAKDKSKEIIIFASEDSQYDGFPSASVTITEDPIKDAIKHLKGNKSSAFLLWSDDDSDCANSLALFTQAKVPVFDLTDGLVPVTAVKGLKTEPAPVIPPQEELPLDEYEDEDEDDDEDEEDEEEGDMEEDLYFGMKAFVKALAKAIVEEMDTLKKASEGDKA
jgi:hypothetical protein